MTKETFEEFLITYNNNIREIYGTHDWIADRGIEILYNHYPSNFIINSIFNNRNDMRAYYLFGTELPDKMVNPAKSFKIKTDYGTMLTKLDFYTRHNVVMGKDGYINRKKQNLFKSAEIIEKKFKEVLKFNNDYQAAVLYLGYISHLIGDACYVHHIYQNPDKAIQQQAKGEILNRTRNTPEEIMWPNSIMITDYDFAKNEFSGQINTLENIFFFCVWHTFFGKPHKSGAFQNIIIPDWRWYSNVKIQEIDKKKQLQLYNKWWNGIIVHLNLAIFYTANAINSLINSSFNF